MWTGQWDELLQRVHQPAHTVTVALVGKYVDLPDAYLSVTEALRAGGFHHAAKVEIRWVESDGCTTPPEAPSSSCATSMRSWFPAASASAASTGRSEPCAMPARTGCPRSVCAWGGCSAW